MGSSFIARFRVCFQAAAVQESGPPLFKFQPVKKWDRHSFNPCRYFNTRSNMKAFTSLIELRQTFLEGLLLSLKFQKVKLRLMRDNICY